MVNFRIVSKIIGSLLFIEAFFMGWCLAVAFSHNQDDALAFLLSVLLTAGSGFVFLYLGRQAGGVLSRRDAYVVVTAAWAIFSFYGMFPFLIHGSITTLTDAYFETMSGFTTTGATIIDDVERLPHGILFWRSLMQWIGGLGIVFFTIAILPSLVGGSVKVFAAEATGPVKTKMHPRLTTTAKWLWTVYLLLTAACALAFWAAGMGWFDAVNYSMTSTATGGFAVHNAGLAHYGTVGVYAVAVVFQFLSGVNFTLLYRAFARLRPAVLWQGAEFRFYTATVLLATLAVGALLVAGRGYGLVHALGTALFYVVSFVTTTGMTTADDPGLWPPLAWVVLGLCMYLGGCAGSTSGGFKAVRAVMLLQVVRNNFRNLLHPSAVLPVRVDGQTVPQSRLVALFAFFALTVLMVLFTATVMSACGVDAPGSLTIALSCVGNVGPPLATSVGAPLLWSALPVAAKWLLCLLMLMGRLEVMTVLVLFTRAFWKEN